MSSLISTIANTFGGNSLLQDPVTEEQEHTSDRVAALSSALNADFGQHATQPSTGLAPITKPVEATNVGTDSDLFIKMFSRNTFLETVEFGTGDVNFSVKARVPVLGKLFAAGKPLAMIKGMWKYFRGNLKLTIQCNAPTGATGAFVAFWVPHHSIAHESKWNWAQVFNWPHVVFNIGNMNIATLRVPYAFHKTFMTTSSDDQFGKLFIMVLSAYAVPTGMPTGIRISVFGAFEDITFTNPIGGQGPTGEGVDKTKSGVTHSTKFKYTLPRTIVTESIGTANLANVVSTGVNISTALAGERIMYAKEVTGQKRPLRDLLEIARIPAMVQGTARGDVEKNVSIFTWGSNKTPGQSIFTYSFTLVQLGNIGTMSNYFHGYSGTIVMEITIFGSVMHKGKLAIVVDQSEKSPTFTPNLDTMNRLQYMLMDIGLNSTIQVPIPFMHDSWMRKTTDETTIRVNLLVVNELTFSATAKNAVNGMIRFKAGDDFKFYFPKPTSFSTQLSWGSEMDLRDPFTDDTSVQEALESNHVQNEQEVAAATGLADAGNAGGLDDIVAEPTPLTVGVKRQPHSISPISYTDVFTFFGRSWLVNETKYPAETADQKITIPAPKVGHASLMNFFTFFAGELNLTVCNDSNNVIVVSHSYQDYTGDNTGAGAVVIPEKQISTFTVPFYSVDPVRGMEDENTFGIIHVNCGYLEGSFKIYASLRCPNFFIPKAFNRKVTYRAVAKEPAKYIRTDKQLRRFSAAITTGVEASEEADFLFEEPDTILTKLEQESERLGYRRELLLLAGDVESNPGPVELVYKHRGLYKHYGVTDGQKVFHLNTEDILYSALTGKAKTMVEDLDASWVHTGKEAEAFGYEIPVEMQFSIDSNCEDFAARFVPHGFTQGQALKMFAGIIFTFSLATAVSDQDITGLFSQLTSIIVDTFTNHITGRILRFLLRCLLYAILFCHGPCLMTGGSVAGLLFMDYLDFVRDKQPGWVKGLIKSMIDGDMHSVCQHLVEGMQDETSGEETAMTMSELRNMVDQGPMEGVDGFNKFTTAAKNVDWWIDLLRKLVEKIKEIFKPDTSKQFANLVKQYQTHLANLFTSVSKAVADSKLPGATADLSFHERVKYLKTQVDHWNAGFVEFCPRHELAITMQSAARQLDNIILAPKKPGTVSRVEPVGVLLKGEPGQGKSFLTLALIKKVCQLKGWSPNEVFQHPVGSKHMDGYRQQPIHVIDDLGQNSSDEDFELLCQMISTVNFPVPMAKLEEKATWYTSKLVIATTNRDDFNTRTVNSSAALERRFGFQKVVCAKRQYQKSGKLDIVNFTDEAQKGCVWSDEHGHDLSVDQLALDVVEEINKREKIAAIWNSFMHDQEPLVDTLEGWSNRLLVVVNDAEDWLFEQLEPPTPHRRFVDKVKNAIQKFGDFMARNAHWFSFGSVLLGIIGLITWFGIHGKMFPNKKEEDNEQVYGGNPTVVAPKTTRFKKNQAAPVHDQGPTDELAHIRRGLVRLVADGIQVFGLSIGDDRILTFGHSERILFRASTVEVVYGDIRQVLENPEYTRLMVSGAETDLAIIKTNAPFRMTSMTKHFTNQLGSEPILIWNTKNGFYSQTVQNLQAIGAASTAEGTWSHAAVTYNVKTGSGTCGGALCVKVGGMYKILGIHIAGNGYIGRAIILPTNQGAFHRIPDLGLVPAHMPKKSKLEPSPLHGVVEVLKGPPPMSDNDPRCNQKPSLQIELKNVGDHFDPVDPNRFEVAVQNVRARLIEVVGVHTTSDIKEAIFDGSNAVDMTTSPGHKYTVKGLRKKDLIRKEDRWVNPLLEADVREMMEVAKALPPFTYFTTAYKDELRSLEKIAVGGVRVIEASNFDYTVCFRMIFGKQLDILCATPAEDTGFAVGINPFTDWTSLVRSLYYHNYDFDYKAFDGSLSRGLMMAAGHALAGTVEDETTFMNLYIATVRSYHHGPGFDYFLEGSNPSGTPFTTVLNCAANLIVVDYFMLTKTTPYLAVTYGDDLILSTEEPVEPEEFKTILKEEFGMNITPSNKESTTFECKKPMEVEFLKRTPRRFTSDTIVGALSVENMLQHIMWCRGLEEFRSQLESFTLELALHGPETYDEVRELFKTKGVVIPKYQDTFWRVERMVYQI
uniref:Genome polyprotein n=2 Tax=Rhinolophus bat shanbavirus TaxID=3039006 RepID=A0AAT9TXC1_9PICO|nr:MAG: polyprotein [Rhinolophus bat shanbavirus]